MTIEWKSKKVKTVNMNLSSVTANYIQVKGPQLRIQRAFLDTFRCIRCIVLPCCPGLSYAAMDKLVMHLSFLYVFLTDYLNTVQYGRKDSDTTDNAISTGRWKSCLRMSKQRHAYARRDPFESTCTTRKGGGTLLRTPVPPI